MRPILIGWTIIELGVVAIIFGLFFIAYEGDFPGRTPHIDLRDTGIDPEVLGGVIVVFGFGATFAGWRILRRSPST